MNSWAYWERRYREGRTSGAGSQGQAALDKASCVNWLIEKECIHSIIDWGVGDGVVLSHMDAVETYIGVDVSLTVLNRLHAQRQPHQRFLTFTEAVQSMARADLALSLDVLQHLVNDEEYHAYLDAVFGSAFRFVLIYNTDYPGGRTARHVLRRKWTPDVETRFPQWEHVGEKPDDPTRPAFFLYRRRL